jgi:hypothetical protein
MQPAHNAPIGKTLIILYEIDIKAFAAKKISPVTLVKMTPVVSKHIGFQQPQSRYWLVYYFHCIGQLQIFYI